MTLLNAPSYDVRRENLKRNVIVGTIAAILLGSILAVAGYILGHGWFFTNIPVEHKVKVFMQTVQSGDYAMAYGIWENDPDWQEHPEKYDSEIVAACVALHRDGLLAF